VDTDVHTDRQESAPIAFRVRKGDRVDGLTGVVITKTLGRAIVREPVTIGAGAPRLDPGETVYVLNYVGEGAWKAWARGQVSPIEIAGKDEVCVGRERAPSPCPVQMLEEPVTEWWAKVRDREGHEGWTRHLDHFGNLDACG
jgi:hypothetical protein